jgi:hypothetical protein
MGSQVSDRVAAAEYLRHIELRSLHLHSAEHRRGFASVTDDVELKSDGELQHYFDEGDRTLGYLVSLNYVVSAPDAENEVAKGSVAFVATYDVHEGCDLTEEQLQEFGHGGAVFQVHPYIREHVMSMCTRSGLPAYALPMLLHDPAARDDGQDEA